MSSAREKVFLNFAAVLSHYEKLPPDQQKAYKAKWLKDHSEKFAELSKKANELLDYLKRKDSRVSFARGDFSRFVHRSHPYLGDFIAAIPMLNNRLTRGNFSDNDFKAALRLIATL